MIRHHEIVYLNKLSILCVLALILSSLLSQSFASEVPVEVIKSVVRITDFNGSGSGFVIAPGHVLTNAHVVEDMPDDKIRVLSMSNDELQEYEAEVIWSSADYDMAVLFVRGLVYPGLPIAHTSPGTGGSVTAIGFPWVRDVTRSDDTSMPIVTRGVIGLISNSSWVEGGSRLKIIHHDADIHGGNSGGPLLNICHEVIGMNTQRLQLELPLIGAPLSLGSGYASHSSEIVNQLSSNSIPYRVSNKKCKTGETRISALLYVLLAASVLIGLVSLYISIRKPKAIVETYTQWKRRISHASDHGFVDNDVNSQPTADALYLVITCDDKTTTTALNLHLLTRTTGVVVGRDKDVSDIVVKNDAISRRHFAIRKSQEQYEICDMSSTNGTQLRDMDIKPFKWVPLLLGEKIFFGNASAYIKVTSAKVHDL